MYFQAQRGPKIGHAASQPASRENCFYPAITVIERQSVRRKKDQWREGRDVERELHSIFEHKLFLSTSLYVQWHVGKKELFAEAEMLTVVFVSKRGQVIAVLCKFIWDCTY